MSEQEDRALKVATWSGWRWLAGSVDLDGDRVIDEGDEDGPRWASGDIGPAFGYVSAVPGPLPDLEDPGTQGCCFALIAEHFRKSMVDALAIIRWNMGRGLSMPEAIVATIEWIIE